MVLLPRFFEWKKVTWVLVASVLGLLSIIYFFFLELLVLATRLVVGASEAGVRLSRFSRSKLMFQKVNVNGKFSCKFFDSRSGGNLEFSLYPNLR